MVAVYAEVSAAEIQACLAQAQAAFATWRRAGWEERGAKNKSASAILRRDQVENARLMAMEMGKPITQGRAECEKCAVTCDYYAERAQEFLSPETIETEFTRSDVRFDPLGVILAVMPWNFPFWQVFRCAVPTLMAGNAVLLKHASNVSGCALAIEHIFREADLPAGQFRALLVGSDRVSELVQSPVIRGVSLTGSVEAGKAIAAQGRERVVVRFGSRCFHGECRTRRAYCRSRA
jgi:succinate-semialdehyde dehydrogenase / glutarate-semialdehyde dehydrogenase